MNNLSLEEQATGQNLQEIESYYLLAESLATEGKWEKAIATYQKLIQLEPNHWQAYHHWGDALFNLNRWDEAIDPYQRAIAINPQYSWSYHNLGLALLKLELWQEATPFFEKAVTLDSHFALAYYHLGEVLAKQEKWNEAIAAYNWALQLDSDLPNLEQKLGDALYCRSQADLAIAFRHYQKALSRSPSPQTEVYFGMVKILNQQNRLSEAVYYCYLAKEDKELEIYKQIRQRRSKLYQPSQEFTVLEEDYRIWRQYNCRNLEDLRQLCLQIEELSYKPIISLILPVASFDVCYLSEVIDSIINQVYPYWQLYIVIQRINNQELTINKSLDSRIQIEFCSTDDIAACANEALNLVTGEIIAYLQAKVLLSSDALAEIVTQFNYEPKAELIYTDEDEINWEGLLTNPWFKSDYFADSFLSRNYFGSFFVCRRDLIEQVGGFNLGYGESYDYDLTLRLVEVAKEIIHIPRILFHCCQEDKDQENAIDYKINHQQGRIQALNNALQRRGEAGKVITNPEFSEVYRISYEIKKFSQVSIIIPTRNLGNILDTCLESIFTLTTYPNYEVVLIDNGSDDIETLAVIDRWKSLYPEKFYCDRLDVPFNYAYLNNYAVTQARGEYLLFLNNDTQIISPDWLEGMVEQSQRSTIGVVGAMLLYPDETVQHAGVILGVTGIAGHSHRGFPANHPGYQHQLLSINNYSAVTGACLMCRREVFEEVGGFDENLAVAYNDVDLCLQIREQGYNIVCLPHVRLYHYESKSRSRDDNPSKQKRILAEVQYMQKKWGSLLTKDCCYSPHLNQDKEDFSLNLKLQAEVIAVSFSQTQKDKLSGFFLDSPYPGLVKQDFLEIAGWVLGCHSPAAFLEVICQGEAIATTQINELRPDVAQVYPHLPEANYSGFLTMVKLADLPYDAEINLQVVFRDGTFARLAKLKLRYSK
jgi:GT2 family glycosyltransferase/Flp pilus assembly protein TadD